MSDLLLVEHPCFLVDMMYARADNMSGLPVYQLCGLGNRAYLHKDAYTALLTLVPELEKMHCKLRICDAYRPAEAHKLLYENVPVPGFFKADYRTSNHCRGTAVDVCLTDEDGNNLLYPTEVDAYDPAFREEVAHGHFDGFVRHLQKARHDYREATPEAAKNRVLLKSLMEAHGFESIMHEWWHYNLAGWQNYPVIDFKTAQIPLL